VQAISEETTDKIPPSHGTLAVEMAVEKQAIAVEISESIVRTLGKNPEMTLAQVASAIGKSIRTIERSTANLVKAGTLKHIGPRKGGHWTIIRRAVRLSKKKSNG
jgi:predicted HTH transcriptional regulator